MEGFDLVGDIVKTIWPSQDEKLKNADLIAQINALPSVQAAQLKLAQIGVTQSVASSHNVFLSFGLALIYFTCGFAFFNDYFLLKVLAYFGVHLQPMSNDQTLNMVYMLLGGGTVHVTHALVTYPQQFPWVAKLKNIFNGSQQ